MKPYPVTIHLYADSEDEIKEAQDAAYQFVMTQYKAGKLVTAKKFAEALTKFKDNPLISRFL